MKKLILLVSIVFTGFIHGMELRRLAPDNFQHFIRAINAFSDDHIKQELVRYEEEDLKGLKTFMIESGNDQNYPNIYRILKQYLNLAGKVINHDLRDLHSKRENFATGRDFKEYIRQKSKNNNHYSTIERFYRWMVYDEEVDHAAQPQPVPREQEEVDQVQKECGICFEDGLFPTLICGHIYCKDCLEQMIIIAIREKSTTNLKCPHKDCKKRALNESEVCAITTPENFGKYLDMKLEEWLAENKATRCPTPDCTYSFIRPDDLEHDPRLRERVHCTNCDKKYCSWCLHDHNLRISCEQAAQDRRVVDNPQEADEEWLKDNTKPCPTCNAQIQKDGGCNKVSCKCGTMFCWQYNKIIKSKYAYRYEFETEDHRCLLFQPGTEPGWF